MIKCTTGSDGAKCWKNYKGQFHRIRGPAIEHNDGTKIWYQRDQLHRTKGPAVEYGDGSKIWYQKDRRHRLDGPAVEYVNGIKEWYYKGTYINCSSQQEFKKIIKLIVFW